MFFNNAKAYIKGGKRFPNINGLVTFKEVSNGVLITAKIYGLPQSTILALVNFSDFIYMKVILALEI